MVNCFPHAVLYTNAICGLRLSFSLMQGFIKECLHQLHRICIDAAAAGFPDHRHMPVALCIFDQPENSRIAGQLIPVRVQRAPARRYLLIGIALQNQRRYTGQTISGDEIFPMAFPTESGDPKLCGGIWGFGIFDNGDEAKIEAAKTFISFIAADPDQVKDSVLASTYFPVRTSVGDIYADNEVMSEYSKFMGYLGDYYQITPGWTTARTEWWNMLQRVGSGEAVDTAVKTFVDNANAAAAAEA